MAPPWRKKNNLKPLQYLCAGLGAKKGGNIEGVEGEGISNFLLLHVQYLKSTGS
jgi:hypothetical protein